MATNRALVLAICFAVLGLASAQTCNPVGADQTFYDPACAQGGLGCNAGGQENCRFCGFSVYPPCPIVEVVTTATTASTTKTTTSQSGGGQSTTAPPPTGTTTSQVLLPTTPKPSTPPNVVNEHGERLIFQDNFDTFNLKTWKHDLTLSGGGNWEFQVYHNNRSNSFVRDGVLHIKPTLLEERIGAANLRNGFTLDLWGGSSVDQCTGNNFYGCSRTAGAGGNILNPIQSAKVTTVKSLNFRYGRVEVRAKLPKGDWLWPAIWLLPAQNQYGPWPASGEIDIMEGRGNKNYPQSAGGGVESFGSTLHWGTDWSQNKYHLTHADYHHSRDLSDEFHTYGLYWSQDRLYTYFDDPKNIILDVDHTKQSYWEKGDFPSYFDNLWESGSKAAPFDSEFYLIINLAVGGTNSYFPNGVGGKPWSDQSPNAVNDFYAAKDNWYRTWQNPDVSFQIDSVKVWSFE